MTEQLVLTKPKLQTIFEALPLWIPGRTDNVLAEVSRMYEIIRQERPYTFIQNELNDRMRDLKRAFLDQDFDREIHSCFTSDRGQNKTYYCQALLSQHDAVIREILEKGLRIRGVAEEPVHRVNFKGGKRPDNRYLPR